MADTLLRNLTVNGGLRDIVISGDRIARIAPAGTLTCDGAVCDDFQGMTAIPGFINMHGHSGMSLMRGVGEDMALHEWLDKIWQIEKDITPEFIYLATKISCLEMIKSGTTTFNDQYWIPEMAHKAIAEMGLRGILSYVILDAGDVQKAERQKLECEELYKNYLTWKDGCGFAVSLHSVYTVSKEMLIWGAEFAREHGLLIHIHMSETRKEVEDCKAAHNGMTPVQYLDSLGILGPDVIAAHSLWLTEKDIDILSKRGVTCVHNINSNAKLSSGYHFLYNELKKAGVNVCLGTDGCASSNNLDMLEAMKTTAIFQKAWRNDPTAMPVDDLFATATVNGARALRLETGELKEGMLADISIVNTDNTFFLSKGSFMSNLIYSAHSDCIDSVFCAGKLIMKHREVHGEKELLSEAREYLSKH